MKKDKKTGGVKNKLAPKSYADESLMNMSVHIEMVEHDSEDDWRRAISTGEVTPEK